MRFHFVPNHSTHPGVPQREWYMSCTQMAEVLCVCCYMTRGPNTLLTFHFRMHVVPLTSKASLNTAKDLKDKNNQIKHALADNFKKCGSGLAAAEDWSPCAADPNDPLTIVWCIQTGTDRMCATPLLKIVLNEAQNNLIICIY